MEDQIKQHFEDFYNKLVFLDRNLGEHEKTFTNNIYHTLNKNESGKIVKSLVFEEKLKDEKIYLRHKGLVLTLVYGTGFNKKYKKIDVYIDKDQHYEGKEEANIDELLSLLDEYIDNNYKEYYEKINKVIFGSSRNRDISVKYRPANILSRDNIKNINIRSGNIKNKDIEHLMKYKNLKSLEISDSKILATNLCNLALYFLSISKCDIASLFCLDRIDTQMLFIHQSAFLSNDLRSLTINTRDLRLDDIKNLNMADFLICTNFPKLKKAKFEGVELKPLEVDLLAALYKAVELEVRGEATSYKFLNELPELEFLGGYIRLIKSEVLKRLKVKFHGEKFDDDNRLANYIFYQIADEVSKRKEFWQSIRLSKIALVKYKGIIEGSNEEDIKRILSLPLSERQKLGREEDITFIPPTEINPFNILLDNLNENYLSKIVGRDGKRLVAPRRIGYTDIYYILGPNGKVMESIEKMEARDITVSEHYEEVRKEIVENDNNIFDYYYNRTFNEPTKLIFLSHHIKDIYLKTIDGFREAYAKNLTLINRRKEIEDLENNLFSDLSILMFSPIHQTVERKGTFRGEETTYLEDVPDDFTEEDQTLYQALKRTRNPEIIDYSLSYLFNKKNTSIEEQEKIKKGIDELLSLWEEKDKLDESIIDEDILVCSYIENNYPKITEQIKSLDYPHWFLPDITSFLDALNLSSEDYDILKTYILIKQCRNKYDYQNKLSQIEDRRFTLSEVYSVDSHISYIESFSDFIDYETSLKNGDITQEDYNLFMEFLDLLKQKEQIKKILDINFQARIKAYEQMMPLIDKLSIAELTTIKESIVKTDDCQDRFNKFVDYLYFYFYEEIPPWIKLELEKSPKVEEKYISETHRRLVKEKTSHVDEHVRVVDDIFAHF